MPSRVFQTKSYFEVEGELGLLAGLAILHSSGKIIPPKRRMRGKTCGLGFTSSGIVSSLITTCTRSFPGKTKQAENSFQFLKNAPGGKLTNRKSNCSQRVHVWATAWYWLLRRIYWWWSSVSPSDSQPVAHDPCGGRVQQTTLSKGSLIRYPMYQIYM